MIMKTTVEKGTLPNLEEDAGMLSDGKEEKSGCVTLPEPVELVVERPNIYAALARAQGQFGRFYKNEDNTFFRSKYLTLAQIFAGIKEVLSELGIAVLQFPSVEYPKIEAPEPVATEQKSGWNTQKNDKATACSAATAPLVTVRTVLAMSEEQKVENSFTVKAKGWDVQSVGSAVTYARRYALLAALGEDFDIDSPPPKCEQTRSSGEEAPKVSVNRLADMCLDNRRRMAKLERLVEKIAEIFKKEETNERNF